MPSESEEREWVREYFDSQSHGDPAVHIEKAATENVGGQVHDVWDVSTKGGRWWVVTNPTNFYSQEDFKSRDVVLTFHIGLTMRVAANHRPPVNELSAMLLEEPWERWGRAVEAMTDSAHPEDFQSVSLRLRECLISLAELLADESLVPEGEKFPKAADGPSWFKYYAGRMAPGSSESRLRGYLTDLATRTWDLTQNVTHKRQALFHDAEIAVAAVSHLLSTFTAASMRWERQGNRRCPECDSYDVVEGRCSRCGAEEPSIESWGEVSIDEEERARRLSEPCTPSSDISTFISPKDYG